MLIDIIRMPPIFGIPINRSLKIYSGDKHPFDYFPNHVHWPTLPLHQENIVVGSAISKVPEHLYKAIHVSYDNMFVFETVFAMELNRCICLYTKIISGNSVEFGLSINAIDHYRQDQIKTLPLSHFIATADRLQDNHYETTLLSKHIAIDNIVPAILGVNELQQYISLILETRKKGLSASHLNLEYKPLYNHEPSVFEALLNGQFHKSPFHEIKSNHSPIRVVQDKWFIYETNYYSSKVFGFYCHINHPEFDSVALAIAKVVSTKFTITSLISHVVDGLKDLWLIREFDDVYQPFLRGIDVNSQQLKQELSNIFDECVTIYCRLFEIDYNSYMCNKFDDSSITISKNIHDEVAITFHDLISDRYVCFYTSLPALLLTTLSVGSY